MMYKVLIIDDEPWSREVVKALGAWEKLQLKVVGEAEDGTVGLKLIKELEPDIVVTDMRMPGLDGVKLLKEINAAYPSLKIIVVSGYDDFVYLKQAICSRAMEYLLKPIGQEELNAALAQCVRELVQAQVTMNKLRSSPLLFEETAVSDRYQAYRRQIYEYLMEQNRAALLQTFEKLGEFLKSALRETSDRAILTQISNDFHLMLDEFIPENTISFDHMLSDGKNQRTVADDCASISKMVCNISRLYMEAIDAFEKLRKNRNSLDLNEVLTYIDRHFQEQISLETVAQHFFVSKEHLSRTFKTFTGENISEYITRRRMEKAKDLITEQKLEIKHIAQLTGYDDLAYFYRVFKKHFGLTPGELYKKD